MIIYEDNHLLIVNKMPGVLVQGDITGDEPVIVKYKKYIKEKYNKPGAVFLHPVHRLDRPVSGCLIFARTSKGLSRMNESFRKQEVQKTYFALCSGRATESQGTLEHYLLKDRKKNFTKIVKASTNKAKFASLDYEIVSSIEGRHLYKITPHTGRSHQIRVQMSNLDCPVIGDLRYNGITCDESRMIYLHCAKMTFDHPTKKEKLTVTAAPQVGQYWTDFTTFLS